MTRKTAHFYVNSPLGRELPKVEIVDEHGATAGEKFYKAGSTIELKCVVSNIPQLTGYITWRHGSRTLNYDITRGGISDIEIMLPWEFYSIAFIGIRKNDVTSDDEVIQDITG
ncbi:unnamed protein product [Xylocopa violacea]|uniref:Ig-like domain-containing protein n=1 Tax=Xylocopa violacea TaxID=135666 RepID=A0ABP1NX81_XYLVO